MENNKCSRDYGSSGGGTVKNVDGDTQLTETSPNLPNSWDK